ncbi:MAG: enoyl-CoA hydratase [Pseudomonadales bacterium]|jgi:enoyl-CoA hydratase|nr:enoyl-CoA hydratase [Pseudomonadales bacterium]MDP7451268.1 enoyl-CoA hydratase [Arenicellales bacterium]MDP7576521.1 enoyl-CoA hydratase [Pseudomonadales bacterium]|tara:strand:- start:123 stop:893 length:771 start_codon:yes stop_codon:yes gene_type:complete
MPEPVLLVEKKDGIAILTLNRPDKMNAMSYELRRALNDELEAIHNDKDIGVVILTGNGKAFCAGLDLKEMGDPEKRKPLFDPPAQLRSLPQPVIGAVNGLAITGGFELLTSCDILIATPEAKFADTHARLGILAGWGLSQRLPRLIGINRAKELSLTGNYLSAELAYEWGLLNRIVPGEELLPTCIELANDMLSCVPSAMQKCKRLMDKGNDLSLGDAMALEIEMNRTHQSPPAEQIAERRISVQSRGRDQAESNE